ncbi:MAG: deoxyribose-phosphate aldolase [Candidatus Melainabacteria bacterium RIFCSPLOWO2_02_FULL_35_15]|nr:MAG: deoxyribose-phosphate aldolase [Candidatus Melainabacteria bacterium RIFCSPLOWO2_12_FULL_35_11]OGI13206.1 MAG: deoxyribose-phosphate aldolase [Candidatus Melainabacteria bacterium RIFCSPLOWO2_02_FULL_35_15]
MQNLQKTFDQSILRPELLSAENIKNITQEALKLGFRAVVVHPCNVELVKGILTNSQVLTVSVCDFPHGKGLTKSRAKDVKEILKLGADEIDVVANYQYLQEGDIRNFKKDLKAITKSMEGKVLKIILEVDLLNERQIKTATQTICKVANEENAKLVIKTKTGFTENKTSNLSAIQIIRRTLEELNQYGEDKIRIKASGGIRTKEEALQLLQAGAHILGVGKGAEIMGAVS